jgi:hypothetical protein
VDSILLVEVVVEDHVHHLVVAEEVQDPEAVVEAGADRITLFNINKAW